MARVCSSNVVRILTDPSDLIPADSAAAKTKRIVEFSDEVKKCLTLLKAGIKHIQGCEGFPCTSCLKSINDIVTVSRNSKIDRNAVGDGLGIDTDYCKMFTYTWKKRDMLQKIEDADPQKDLSHETTQMFTFYIELLASAMNFTDQSDYFCLQMEEDGCLSLIVDWFLHLVRDDKAMNKWVDDMMFDAMNMFDNVCRKVPSLAPKHHRAVPAFQKFSKSKDSMTQTKAVMILAKLVKKEEADKLSTDYICILTLLSDLKGCLENPEHEKKTDRKTSIEKIVTTITSSAGELAQAIDDLTINDNNKQLVVEHGVIPILAKLLQRDCSVEEKTSAANVVWRLAFLKENKEKLRKERDIIYNLSEGSRHINEKLRDACEGALFEINKTTDVESPPGAPHSGPGRNQRKVSDEMLNNVAKKVPSYDYDQFSEKLGVNYNEARNILTKYQSDYKEATRECLAKWTDRSTRSVADLHDVLRAAELGGLIGKIDTSSEVSQLLSDEEGVDDVSEMSDESPELLKHPLKGKNVTKKKPKPNTSKKPPKPKTSKKTPKKK